MHLLLIFAFQKGVVTKIAASASCQYDSISRINLKGSAPSHHPLSID